MVREEQLYDLVFDPHERNNLIGDPLYAETHKDLHTRLWAWMKRTDDPILKGPVPLAPGGVTNDVDDVSPKRIKGHTMPNK